MTAPAQQPSGAVYIGPEGITFGQYSFNATDVRDVRVSAIRPERVLWLSPIPILAIVLFIIAEGYEDSVFSWSRVFGIRGIVYTAMLALFLAVIAWLIFFRNNPTIYFVQAKLERGWTSIWATLDESAAQEVAGAVESAANGEQVSLAFPPALRLDGNLLLLGNQSYPLSQVSSATRREQWADHSGGLSFLFINGMVLSNALGTLVRSAFDWDPSRVWVTDILMVIGIACLIGLVVGVLRFANRRTLYVYVVQLRGEFGRRNVYATIDETEADAIVSSINNAVAANAQT
jgi:multisubunit Na+/H+ antiporter MnhB subunit